MSPVVEVLEDGTRVYSTYRTYKPVPDHLRKTRRLKPEDPRAVRFGAEWFLPLEDNLLALEDRGEVPETRPDEIYYHHLSKATPCRCAVCKRDPKILGRWRRKWQREHGLPQK